MSLVRRAAAGAAVVLALLAGCGEDTTPADQVPALAERLERVDAAVEAGDFARARREVQALVNETAQARVDGRLGSEDAEQIMQAAAVVLERLPEDADTPETTTTPSPTPTPDLGGLGGQSEEQPEDSGDEDEKDDQDDQDEKGKDDKGKGHGKGRD